MTARLCTLIIGVALAALSAPMASAGGINLAWDDCVGFGGVTNKNFACNVNGPTHTLFASFDPDIEKEDFYGLNAIIDLQSASTPLPPWWQFKNPGSCRMSSLSATVIVTGTCTDPWLGEGIAGIGSYVTAEQLPSLPPNRARILAAATMANGLSNRHVIPGTEYFAVAIRINDVGTDVCSGCNDPVCLVLNETTLYTYNSGEQVLTSPLVRNDVTWQGGAIGDPGCPAATPTANRTWGQLKSIYH